jgi:REP element-mobilizing transposase RayT
MAKVREKFSGGVWYHCYNLSIEERLAFEDGKDYGRFIELLYLANDRSPLRRDDIGPRSLNEVLSLARSEPLVTLGAFCLMPGHFHLALKERSAGGITAFMRKIGTAYTLYFNGRHKRVGNLFLKPFRSLVVPDTQVESLVSYIHCNPASLYEPGWKSDHVVDPQFLGERIGAYPYSSMSSYGGVHTPLRALLDRERLSQPRVVSIQKMLQEARQYSATRHLP